MYRYRSMQCRSCGQRIEPRVQYLPNRQPASCYLDCLYQCNCGAGYSNDRIEKNRKLILRDYRKNIPEEVREGIDCVLCKALNVLNRSSKKNKFASENSEDAVTWTVFRYLYMGQEIGYGLGIDQFDPTVILYWGTSWPNNQDHTLSEELRLVLTEEFHELNQSLTEPDVILEDDDYLVFIEAKYNSPNDVTSKASKFSRYLNGQGDLFVKTTTEVIDEGYYELTRNWVIGSKLAGRRNKRFVLINLTRENNCQSAGSFAQLIQQTNDRRFKYIAWPDLLNRLHAPLEQWFREYVNLRGLQVTQS